MTVIVFCRPCTTGSHQCVDIVNDPHVGLTACDCQPCDAVFNERFWAANTP